MADVPVKHGRATGSTDERGTQLTSSCVGAAVAALHHRNMPLQLPCSDACIRRGHAETHACREIPTAMRAAAAKQRPLTRQLAVTGYIRQTL